MKIVTPLEFVLLATLLPSALGLSPLHCGLQPVRFTSSVQQLPPCLFLTPTTHSTNVVSDAVTWSNSTHLAVEDSEIAVQESSAVPDSQGWSSCRKCVWTNDGFVAVDPRLKNERDNYQVDLTWSLWGEFFHHYFNDQMKVDLRKQLILSLENTFVVKNPVFVLPLITFHVGHILIDVLEEVYNSMMLHYGEIRKDCLIVFDVANEAERPILQEKLFRLANAAEADHLGKLLHLLTDLPVIATEMFSALQLSNTSVVFESIHFGLDISSVHFYRGYRHHPCLLNLETIEFQELSKRYVSFRDFLMRGVRDYVGDVSDIGEGSEALSSVEQREPTTASVRVTIVQRQSNRVLEGLSDVILWLQTSPLEVEVTTCDLDNMSFSEQIGLFQQTNVLIAAGGTAIHNAIFFPRNTVIVILMPRGWCPWSWMYANQVLLLGMKPVVYCSGLANSSRLANSNGYYPVGLHWTRKFWLQGPRMLKSSNISIDLVEFQDTLLEALKLFKSPELFKTNRSIGIDRINKSSRCFGKYKPESELESPEWDGFGQGTDRPPFQLVLTSVKSEKQLDDRYKLSLMGEIISKDENFERSFQPMFHLSVCLNFTLTSAISPFCYPISAFNYYSEVYLTAMATNIHLHFWLQASNTGGKFRFSDCFVALDTRMGSQAGFEIHHLVSSVGLLSETEVKIDYLHNMNTEENELITVAVSSLTADIIHDWQNQQREVRSVVATFNVSTSYCIQYHTAAVCRQLDLSFRDCGRLAQLFSKSVYSAFLLSDSKRPQIQHVPSPTNPFVFIHIDKSAGTTIREFIEESAIVHGLEYFIPCHGPVHCVTFEVRPDDPRVCLNTSVLAGHFSWGAWNNFPMARHGLRNRTDDGFSGRSFSPSCLVMGRHPVDRAISYYYDRCYDSLGCVGFGKRINDLTSEELHLILKTRGAEFDAERRLHIVDDGISEAACRLLTNTRQTTGTLVPSHGTKTAAIDELQPFDDRLTATALNNVENCVVGLLEDYSTSKEMISHWFPWLDFNTRSPDRRRMFKYKDKETRFTIRPDLVQILEDQNRCDMKVYERMVELFEDQKKIMSFVGFQDDEVQT